MSKKENFLLENVTTVSDALSRGTIVLKKHFIPTSRLDCEVLLSHTLGLDRVGLYREMNRKLSEQEKDLFNQCLLRRTKSEPVSYIRGKKEFYSLEFNVDSTVLAPRPETELLVKTAIEHLSLKKGAKPFRILDVGTGSGAIAISILKNLKSPSSIWAVDKSPAALKPANKNAIKHGVEDKIAFLKGDLFDSVSGKFDLIVSNPPYIEKKDIDMLAEDIKLYEPRLALDGGAQGLDCIDSLIKDGIQYLGASGIMLIEIGKGQSEIIKEIDECSKYSEISFIRDFSNVERVMVLKG